MWWNGNVCLYFIFVLPVFEIYLNLAFMDYLFHIKEFFHKIPMEVLYSLKWSRVYITIAICVFVGLIERYIIVYYIQKMYFLIMFGVMYGLVESMADFPTNTQMKDVEKSFLAEYFHAIFCWLPKWYRFTQVNYFLWGKLSITQQQQPCLKNHSRTEPVLENFSSLLK